MTWLENYSPLGTGDLAALADGKHPLATGFIHVMTTTSRLRSECLYECHRHYCDVQMVLQGQEWLFNTETLDLTPSSPFDEQADIGFFTSAPEEAARVTLRPGLFALLFPWDAHLPAIAPNDVPAELRKCVAKIPLSDLHISSMNS